MRLVKGYRVWFAMFLTGVAMSACVISTPAGLDNTTTPTVTSTTSTSTPSPTETAADPTPLATPTVSIPEQSAPPNSYAIHAVYDFALQQVSVKQVIRYTHLFDRPLNELILLVEPNRFANGFRMNQLVDASSGQSVNWELDGNLMRVYLEEPLSLQDRIELIADYVLQLPQIPPPSEDAKPQIYGYTDRQTNLVDWYLWLPPYDEGQGWVVNPPAYFGEYTVYPLADFEVALEVIHSPRDVVVAASTRPVQQGQNRWDFRFSRARNFALSISADFLVSETEVQGVKIHSYYFPMYQRQGEVVLTHTAQAFSLYSELFGPLPRTEISVVQADFLDGMEFDGLFFLSKGFYELYDGTDKGYLTIISVHETAHLWWYAAVANDQAQHPWLDESLCTYAERLYYERYLPDLVDWWWYYRVNFYQPEGVIDLPVYDYQGYTAYRDAVYLRGATFLEELRQLLGDEKFFEGMRHYYAAQIENIASPNDFFATFESYGVDFSNIREKYFYREE